MADTPTNSGPDAARQEVVRLSELFRRSFASLDADARTAGQRWAGEIDRELSRSGNVGVRADTRQALSDIRSLDRELDRNRAINVGADIGAPAGAPAVSAGSGGLGRIGGAVAAASDAAMGLTAAVGGVVGTVNALSASTGRLADTVRKIAAPVQPSGSAGSPQSVSLPGIDGVGDALGRGPASVPSGTSGGAMVPAGTSAVPGLDALRDGLSKVGGGGVPGNVTVGPLTQPSVAAAEPDLSALSSGGSGQVPAAVPAAAMDGVANPVSAGLAPESSGPRGFAPPLSPLAGGTDIADQLRNALQSVSAVVGGLPDVGSGLAVPNLPAPEAPGGLNPPNVPGLPSADLMSPTPALTSPGRTRPPGADSVGASGVGELQPAGTPAGAASGGSGIGNPQSATKGVLEFGGDAQGMGPGGVPGLGRSGALSTGRISIGPGSDPMGSAPTGAAGLTPLGSDGGNPLLGALLPGFGGTTNNQSSSTININGDAGQPGMDVFMSFVREFRRWGGLAGAVGGFLQ